MLEIGFFVVLAFAPEQAHGGLAKLTFLKSKWYNIAYQYEKNLIRTVTLVYTLYASRAARNEYLI